MKMVEKITDLHYKITDAWIEDHRFLFDAENKPKEFSRSRNLNIALWLLKILVRRVAAGNNPI